MKLRTEVGLGPGDIVLDGNPAGRCPKKGEHSPQFSAHVCCGQTGGWIKMPVGTEVDLSLGHIVSDGDPALPERGTEAPSFWPMSMVAKWSPISATTEHLYFISVQYVKYRMLIMQQLAKCCLTTNSVKFMQQQLHHCQQTTIFLAELLVTTAVHHVQQLIAIKQQ